MERINGCRCLSPGCSGNSLLRSRAFNKDLVTATNAVENPGVFESQVLSLFAEGEINNAKRRMEVYLSGPLPGRRS